MWGCGSRGGSCEGVIAGVDLAGEGVMAGVVRGSCVRCESWNCEGVSV